MNNEFLITLFQHMDWLDEKTIEMILLVLGLLYVAMEVLLNLNNIGGDTSNLLIYDMMKKKSFFLSFALGSIIGHLFFGADKDYILASYSESAIYWSVPVIILGGLSLIMILLGVFLKFEKPKWFLFSLLLSGIGYGHFFWSMNY